MSKKSNPHHIDNEQNASIQNLSFSPSQNVLQLNKKQQNQKLARKMKVLSIIIKSLFQRRIVSGFNSLKYKPIKLIRTKKRLVQVFLGLVRRSQFNHKRQSFHFIKIFSIKKHHQNIAVLQNLICKAKNSSAKVINILFNAKQKQFTNMGFQKIQSYAKQIATLKNQRFRRGLRILIHVKNTIIRKYFTYIRNSRFLIQRKYKVQNIGKIFRQYRNRSLKISIQKLKRNLYQERQSSVNSQLKMIESRILTNEDQQLKQLKAKQELLQKNLTCIKKQKQQIQQAYQIEVKDAESKNVQIQSKINEMKQENKLLQKQIEEIQAKLKQQYSLEQIFQMFYNNFLLYVSKNRNKQLLKNQMLEVLTKPLIPVDIPLQKLKQQNRVMKQLINEYVLMYGQKSIQGKDCQLPYEYLVKQNGVMYKMLMTLLPRINYNKKQVNELRQTLNEVEKVVKQFKG